MDSVVNTLVHHHLLSYHPKIARAFRKTVVIKHCGGLPSGWPDLREIINFFCKMDGLTMMLPLELQEKILSMLSFHDLKRVVRVSRGWRKMGQNPHLWRHFKLLIKNKNRMEVNQLMRIGRFTHLRSVKFDFSVPCNIAETTLDTMDKHEIKELNMSGSKLSKVQPWRMAYIITKMEKVEMNNCRLSSPQLKLILEKLVNTDSMTELDIGTNDLSTSEPRLMSSLVLLKVLHIPNTNLTPAQTMVLFTSLVDSNVCKVKELNVRSNDLSSVPPDMLASSLCRMEKAMLWGCQLSGNQVQKVFQEVGSDQGCGQLRELEISDNDLSSVEAMMLTRAVTVLNKAFLAHTNLNFVQINVLLTEIQCRGLGGTLLDKTNGKVRPFNLSRLDIDGNNVIQMIELVKLCEIVARKLKMFRY